MSNTRTLQHRRTQRARRYKAGSYSQLVLIEQPRRPFNPPAFEGPKEPTSIQAFLRQWMQLVDSGAGKPEYAQSIPDLADRHVQIGRLSNREYRAFRRGKLKIVTGVYPKAIQESISSMNPNHVIQQEFTYDVVFER